MIQFVMKHKLFRIIVYTCVVHMPLISVVALPSFFFSDWETHCHISLGYFCIEKRKRMKLLIHQKTRKKLNILEVILLQLIAMEFHWFRHRVTNVRKLWISSLVVQSNHGRLSITTVVLDLQYFYRTEYVVFILVYQFYFQVLLNREIHDRLTLNIVLEMWFGIKFMDIEVLSLVGMKKRLHRKVGSIKRIKAEK